MDDIKRAESTRGAHVPAQKGLDEIFCPSCGKIIKQAAVLCVHCGVQNAALPTQAQPVTAAAPLLKQKSSAILLAVFLGFWTWLYTYKKDAWKFWLNLALSVASFGIWALVAWIWAIIDVCIKPEEYYANFHTS